MTVQRTIIWNHSPKKQNKPFERKALEAAYPQVVSQDAPAWEENTDILQWLQNLCRP